MPKDEQQKEAWEVAWEREYPGDSAHFNSTNAAPFRMVRERWRFQRGYEVACDAAKSGQEAAVRAAREQAWADGYDTALADIRQKCGEDGPYLFDREMTKNPYSNEPTKEPT